MTCEIASLARLVSVTGDMGYGKWEMLRGKVVSTGRVGAGGGPVGVAGLGDGLISGCLDLYLFVHRKSWEVQFSVACTVERLQCTVCTL